MISKVVCTFILIDSQTLFKINNIHTYTTIKISNFFSNIYYSVFYKSDFFFTKLTTIKNLFRKHNKLSFLIIDFILSRKKSK